MIRRYDKTWRITGRVKPNYHKMDPGMEYATAIGRVRPVAYHEAAHLVLRAKTGSKVLGARIGIGPSSGSWWTGGATYCLPHWCEAGIDFITAGAIKLAGDVAERRTTVLFSHGRNARDLKQLANLELTPRQLERAQLYSRAWVNKYWRVIATVARVLMRDGVIGMGESRELHRMSRRLRAHGRPL